jgi:uncharacterized protein (TIGR03067 family)
LAKAGREPPPAPEESGPETDERRIAGLWEVIEDRQDGKPLRDSLGVQLLFQGGEITQIDRGKPTKRWRYRLRPTLKRKGFDSVPQGRRIWHESAIYQLRDSRLVLCYGAQGEPRPTEFETRLGDGRRVVVLEHVRAHE